MDIAAWLRKLGLERYGQAFRENEVGPDVLPKLTAEDLKEIGVVSVGDRRRLLEAIAVLAREDKALSQAARGVGAPPHKSAEAERRQLTVLFCDLVGSTELATRLDPEDMGAVMSAYHRATAAVIERFDGHVAKYLGDGVLAYFGWPKAHEDDAERAVRAGLGLVGAVARLEPREEMRLQARVGVATGHVVVGDLVGEGAARDEAVVGETPNLAARLQTLAAPESVVISQATRRLVRGLFELEDLGPQRLKGFAEPQTAWRVEGEACAEGRFEARQTAALTPLVGREEEISLLLRHWEQARDGEGQVVLLSGEPGIGKSRIVREVRKRLAAEPHLLLTHQCSPYHQASPLRPVVEHLERAGGFLRDDPPEARLDKLESLLARGTDRIDEAVPLIAALLGIPTGARYPALELTPERQKQWTLEALLDQLEGLATEQPVLLVYEDVHWIDPTTHELLGLIVNRTPELGALVLITFRPEYTPPAWSGHAHVSSLMLNRLGPSQCAAMVAKVTGDKPVPAEMLDLILDKTDGVPLFVEELTKAVLEAGLLGKQADRYVFLAPKPSLTLPWTLKDSLTARLDHLASAKEVAQIGAVIGREFSYELLSLLAGRPAKQVKLELERLIEAGLILPRRVRNTISYVFKHALVRDAAYETLLRSKRQRLHAAIVTILEQEFPERAELEPALLAHHCTHGGLTERAILYWHHAGEGAMGLYAYQEAYAYFTQALEMMPQLPATPERAAQRLQLELARGPTLVAIKGYASPEVEHAYQRALELCEEIADKKAQFMVQWNLWNLYLVRAELYRARRTAEKLLELASVLQEPALLLEAHAAMTQTSCFTAELIKTRHHAEEGLKIYDAQRHHSLAALYGQEDPGVTCYIYLGVALWLLGFPEQASQKMAQGLNLARDLAHPFNEAFALFFAGVLHKFRREAPKIQSSAQELISIGTTHGLSYWSACGVVLKGWALAEQGQLDEGVAEMKRGMDLIAVTGARSRRPFYLVHLAEAYHRLAHFETAMSIIGEALSLGSSLDEHYWESEICRVKGNCLVDSNRMDEAITCYRDAMNIARRQEAKSWELRAVTSLCRLLLRVRKRSDAQAELAQLYNWFTEGFDTADLKDAKALLDELA